MRSQRSYGTFNCKFNSIFFFFIFSTLEIVIDILHQSACNEHSMWYLRWIEFGSVCIHSLYLFVSYSYEMFLSCNCGYNTYTIFSFICHTVHVQQSYARNERMKRKNNTYQIQPKPTERRNMNTSQISTTTSCIRDNLIMTTDKNVIRTVLLNGLTYVWVYACVCVCMCMVYHIFGRVLIFQSVPNPRKDFHYIHLYPKSYTM